MAERTGLEPLRLTLVVEVYGDDGTTEAVDVHEQGANHTHVDVQEHGSLGGAIGHIVDAITARRCRRCGCTDELRCLTGCRWVAGDLCSTCEGAIAFLGENRAELKVVR